MDRQGTPWIRTALYLALGAATLVFLVAIGDVVQLVVVAALLAYLLDPLARELESRGLGRPAATVVIFAALVLLVGGLGVYLVPVLVGQLQAAQAHLQAGEAAAAIEAFERALVDDLRFLGIDELNLVERFQAYLMTHVDDLVDYVPSLVPMLAEIILVPFIMFFLLKDWRRMKRGFANLVPNRYFEFALSVLHKADVQLGNYLRGQVVDAVLVGVLSVAALWALEVDYYVLIGAIAGVANLIPYVGPVAGSVVAVLVSLMTGDGPMHALWIVAAFGAIQVVDNAVLHPLVVARTVSLHPLLIVLVVLIGGKFFGILGLLLAVPAAAVAKVLLAETLENLRRYRLA